MSPNYTKNRKGYKPEAIVIHIAEGTYQGTINWINNPNSLVSYHYLIGKDGKMHQAVELENSAWHAGKISNSTWKLLKQGVNPNYYTIGISLAGFAHEKPTIIQILATAILVMNTAKKYQIPIDQEHIIPHRWINTNKTCPGYNIDINVIIYLAKLRLSVKNL